MRKKIRSPDLISPGVDVPRPAAPSVSIQGVHGVDLTIVDGS